MYVLGEFLLLSALLVAVLSVWNGLTSTLKLDGPIKMIPIFGSHQDLGIAILMVWTVGVSPAAGWGISTSHAWMNIVINGAIVYGFIPLKDAVISMVSKGFRA